MKNVCLIAAWRRPEFLWHCIANIKLATGAEQLHYIFRLDHGYDPECMLVIDGFPFSYEVRETPKTHYQIGKQSYSLLTGYQYAALQATDLVFMIEEDVMVAGDFFRWHLAVQEQRPEAFCSIAVANPNRIMNDACSASGDYYIGGGDYCSLGVCFRREVILERIAPFCETAYFANPVDYVHRRFKGLPIGHAFAEQDGLIRRIEMVGPRSGIVWPWVPKAYHAGYYGKNRGAGPRGTLAQRIANLADIIYSDEAMRTFAKHPEWYEDSRPIDLTAKPWTRAQLTPLDPHRNPVRF